MGILKKKKIRLVSFFVSIYFPLLTNIISTLLIILCSHLQQWPTTLCEVFILLILKYNLYIPTIQYTSCAMYTYNSVSASEETALFLFFFMIRINYYHHTPIVGYLLHSPRKRLPQ